MLRQRSYILLIIFLGLILYAKGLQNGFVGDDDIQIVRNFQVHSFLNIPSFFSGSTYSNAGASTLAGIYYRPVMMSVYSIIYSFFGPNPLPFHLVQLLLHIANTIILFLFLKRFFKEGVSFLLAVIFLVHPVNSEAVLYAANLQEVLFFFFGMAALLLLQKRDLPKMYRVFIPFLVLLSLFSKETGVLFLFILPVYCLLFEKDKTLFRFLLISFSIVFAVYLFFRYAIAHMYLANTSLAPITNASLSLRLLNIPAIIGYYLRMFFYPQSMEMAQFWFVTRPGLTNFYLPLILAVLFMALLLGGLYWIGKYHKTQKNTYLFFFIWFSVGLLLHLQILPLDATVADRWFYFPIVGLIGMLGIIITQIKIVKSKNAHIFLGILLGVIICLLSARTFIRISNWQSSLTLYSHDVHSPDNFIVENAYGSALIKNDQFTQASKHVLLSIQEHPYTANLNNMAIIETAQGNRNLANAYFIKAIGSGQNFSVYENYANFLLYYEKPHDAIGFSKEGLKVFPQSAPLWLVLAQAEYLNGEKSAALAAVRKAYVIEPDEKIQDIENIISHGKKLSLALK